MVATAQDRTMNTSVRRRTVVLIALGAIASSACGSSEKKTTTVTSTTASTSSTSSSTPSTTTPTPPTTRAPTALEIAVWPTAGNGLRYHDPVAVTRSFAIDYLHFVNPVVGPFRPGDTHSGEVPVRAHMESTALGPTTTVIVRQLGADGSWWVLGASTPNIALAQPATLSTITSPVRLRGTSTAFEATVRVFIRQDDVVTPLVESYLMGGANGQMAPFDVSFTFAAPTSRYGAIVLDTTSSANGQVVEATVIRVRLS